MQFSVLYALSCELLWVILHRKKAILCEIHTIVLHIANSSVFYDL